MIIAIEDAVSEAVVARVLARVNVQATTVIGRRGNDYLKKKCRELNRAATALSVLILTDLDIPNSCPARLRAAWLPDGQNERLLFRVAVLEVEAWVLADHDGFAGFAGISAARIPSAPDSIPNPKQTLVNLCRKSRLGSIRSGMVPSPKSTAAVGPEYNSRLCAFIANRWNPELAALRSPSLERAIRRIVEHVDRFPGA